MNSQWREQAQRAYLSTLNGPTQSWYQFVLALSVASKFNADLKEMTSHWSGQEPGTEQ